MANNNEMTRREKSSGRVMKSATLIREQYYGPIPPASELEKYEEIQAGFADRIISMAEKQSDHRRKMEEKALDANIKMARLGQVIGFCVFVFAIVLGFTLIMSDKPTEGLVSILTSIVAIVSLFVFGRFGGENKNTSQGPKTKRK